MKLSLHKFMCWDELELEIPINQITLIKADSGVGKTTLFKAIDWVLYGETKKIGPRHTPNAKTKVSLSYNNLSVTRTKNPNKLMVTYDNIIYEDLNAQKKIDQLYGEHDVWMATSYVKQMSYNHFAITSNSSKLELLNKLSFHDQDPNEYINKIDKTLEKNKTIYQCKSDEFNKNQMLDYDDTHILSNKQFDTISNELSNLEQQEVKFNTLKKQYDIHTALQNTYRKELDALSIRKQNLIKPVLESIDKDVNELQDYVSTLKTIEQKKTRLKQLKIELDKYDVNDIIESFTLNDLQEATNAEKIYHRNDILFKQLDLEHDQELVDDYIEHLNNVLNAQEKLLKEETLNQLTLKIVDELIVPIEPEIIDIQSLEERLNELNINQVSLKHELNHLLETKDAIKCPYCENDVLYKKGELIKVIKSDNEIEIKSLEMENNKRDIVILKQKIEELKSKQKKELNLYQTLKNQYENNQKIYNQINIDINQLKLEINQLPDTSHPLLSMEQKNQIYKVLGQLKNITIVQLPVTPSETIKKYLTMQDNNHKRKVIQSQYDELLNEIPDINTDCIKSLEVYIHDYKKYLLDYDYIYDNIATLQEKIINMDDPLPQLNEIINKISVTREQINNHKQAIVIKEENLKLKLEKEELDKLMYKIDYLTQLKNKAIQVECEILKNLVNNINYNMHEICNPIFEHDIKIELGLYKTLKVAQKLKQDVNFNIVYKGGKYDSILEVSGGEADRLSLAMTLALHKLSSNPILIFDESLKGLNIELKEDIIKTIREHINSTVLIVDFGGIDGIVDHVINVDQYIK